MTHLQGPARLLLHRDQTGRIRWGHPRVSLEKSVPQTRIRISGDSVVAVRMREMRIGQGRELGDWAETRCRRGRRVVRRLRGCGRIASGCHLRRHGYSVVNGESIPWLARGVDYRDVPKRPAITFSRCIAIRQGERRTGNNAVGVDAWAKGTRSSQQI